MPSLVPARPSGPARSLVAAAVAAVLLVLAGCTPAGGPDGDAASASPSAPTPSDTRSPLTDQSPEGFEDFFAQQIAWEDCGDGFECATIEAPLSWREAGSGSIELALKRHPATGTSQGSVLVNPGGPGGSGVDFVTESWSRFGERLRSAFDVVGFDPRGVGASTPIRCLDDREKDLALSRSFDVDDAGLDAMAADAAAWGAACLENSGELLGNVDTQSAARDMDLIRALLGEERLNFLGFSYGTALGATFATMFPDRVGAMVLDGAIDVTLSVDESTAQQAAGFEQALRAYVEDCQGGSSCPLTGSVDDGLQQVRDLLDRTLRDPLPTQSGRRVTQTLAFLGIAVTLYDQNSWPALTQALQEAIGLGSGNTLLFLADFYNDRNEDGTFASNSTEAFRAVNCLDGRGTTDRDEMRAQAAAIEEQAPTMGRFFGFGGLGCWDWPFPEVEPLDFGPVDTELPIVVVGTTGDPATPFEGAEALTETLGNAVLVTFEGEGHTAYARSNACIVDAIDAFFVDNTVPADGLRC